MAERTVTRPVDPEKRARRLPPVRLDVLYDLYRFDPSRSLLYLIAAAEGRSRKDDGTYNKPGHGEGYVGVWVGNTHRDRILETLDLKPARWRAAVRQWVGLELVHRCEPGGLFLLQRPGTECPRCSSSVAQGDGATSSTATFDVADSDAFRHEVGEPQRGTRKGNGMGAGLEGSRPEEVAQEGVQKSAAPLCENEAPPLTADEAWARLHPDETKAAG
jgi:hypothetical protein